MDAYTNKMESRYSRYISRMCNTRVLIKGSFISVVQMGLPSEQGDTKQTENDPSSKQTTAETLVRTEHMSDRFLVKNQVNNHVCCSKRSRS